MEFLDEEVLEYKSWPYFCGQLEADLVQCEQDMRCYEKGGLGMLEAKSSLLDCLCGVGADAEMPVSFLLEKTCKV